MSNEPLNDRPLNETELAALRAWDTPTICNALELTSPERRSIGFTVEPLVCAFPDLPPMVGYARTANIRSVEPSTRPGAEMRDQRLNYYRYVAEGPGPTIAIIQDMDGPRRAYGAFWGEVQSTIHHSLGCLGVVTDGSVRDIDAVAPGFQFIADRIGPSHAHVHLEDFGKAVNVSGMMVHSGDLIHADRHGAVIQDFPSDPGSGRRHAVRLPVFATYNHVDAEYANSAGHDFYRRRWARP